MHTESITTFQWLLLVHQLPPKPDYLRVKVRRRLQALGAVAVKNTVYLLPDREQQLEDFNWLLKEIQSEGGDAYLCRASVLAGLNDDELVSMFNEGRREVYEAIAEQANVAILNAAKMPLDGERTRKVRSEGLRLRRAVEECAQLDFFASPARAGCEQRIDELELLAMSNAQPWDHEKTSAEFHGRTWVTRQGVYVDRIASAWLIRRRIDPDPHFRFVDPATYTHQSGELRFDMFEGEYTHAGEHCTFEVLLESFSIEDPVLGAIAEIVHDIDLKDSRYNRPEMAGVRAVLEGMRAQQITDEERLQRGALLFDALEAQLAQARSLP